MAKSDISDESRAVCDTMDTQELEWILAKSLLDANARCTEAFEYYFLHTHWPDGNANLESVGASIHQVITEHERIIEDLELAAEAVEELQQER